MTVNFTIQGKLAGLNDYTKACRCNRYVGARMKEENERKVLCAVMQSPSRNTKLTGKVVINYRWYESNKRRDLDNIAFAKKFIQDALVEYGVLQGDGWRHIVGFNDMFYVDKDNPRIEVEISEVENE